MTDDETARFGRELAAAWVGIGYGLLSAVVALAVHSEFDIPFRPRTGLAVAGIGSAVIGTLIHEDATRMEREASDG